MNRSRAEDVKKMEEEIEKELKKFDEGRREKARFNHLRKVADAMK